MLSNAIAIIVTGATYFAFSRYLYPDISELYPLSHNMMAMIMALVAGFATTVVADTLKPDTSALPPNRKK